ncbi:MAG: glutamate-1-semialdehyde 2,1-aminomutase [Thermodesulfobacteriota bacterium]
MGVRKSATLFKKAQKVIPGGVNSPVRAFNSVGGSPLFIASAKGSKIYDADGNAYIDYVGSWGPMILGHGHPKVNAALKRGIASGTSFGAPTALEIELAELTLGAFPSMDMVRFVSSGTEATMSAIRLARGFTGRDGIIKFEGCYHGHADGLLVKAGSGAATFGVPTSPGVPKDFARHTYNAKFNDLESVEKIFKKNRRGIACVIVEGSPGNMGVVPPAKGFMKGLKRLTKKYGALLIMDEVMSGFRLCYGGAQKVHGVTPDITCLGKVIGGGLPVGAFGGKRKIMKMLSPSGPVYQAGTLSGNPLAMTAGIETLNLLKKPGTYEKIIASTTTLADGIREIVTDKGLPYQVQQAGSMLTLFFTKKPKPVCNFKDAAACEHDKFAEFFQRMLKCGIYLPPSSYEAAFVGLAHSRADIAKTLEAVDKSLKGF